MHSTPVARKALLKALIACVLFAGVLSATVAPRASADTSCFANSICIWDQINYGGSRMVYDCANVGNWSTPFGNPYRSAKNRCGSKYNILHTVSGPVCMAPGGDRPSPGYFQVIAFLNWGQTC